MARNDCDVLRPADCWRFILRFESYSVINGFQTVSVAATDVMVH
jgi:hypothetical protein